MSSGVILPVVLSGGSGTRLWPLSRKSYPKQFLKLGGSHSLFQQTCARVGSFIFDAPYVFCNDSHRFIVAEQVQEIGLLPKGIFLEPVGRNTAPAVLVASLAALRENENALLLLLPSDHVIGDDEEFVASVETGINAARNGKFVTFGVRPDSPHTGYGYIETRVTDGEVLDVARFVEKPTLTKAESFLEAGSYFWNAGIFLFSASSMVAAFEEHSPEMVTLCRDALENSDKDLDFIRLNGEAYAQCEDISLDYAIMEKSENIGCVPLETDWDDLGSWGAISELVPKDEDGNREQGDVMFVNSRNCYGYSEDGARLVVNGMDDVIVVATKDAILVTSKEAAQGVKTVVEKLETKNCNTTTDHTKVFRPWGWYEGLHMGERFQVKCIMVKPGEKLSLQSHHHRAEHWVVVSGTARVTVNDTVRLLTENQSTYVPLGAIHRLENPGLVPALMIEVQSGAYLGEDDIVRYEDIYNRES